MSFRTVNGRAYSENGWRFCNRDECDDGPVPGTSLRLPIRGGIANLILKGWCAYFHARIESLNNHRGFTDEGSWTRTNSVSTSNHLAATAVDLNWDDHAFRVSYDGFTQDEINKTRHGLDLFRGTIWWGQDWNSPIDCMHFQLNFPEGDARNAALATELRNGYLGIWGSGNIPEVPTPVDGPRLLEPGVSGDDVRRLQNGLNRVFNSYGKPLDVDGDYGPLTAAVVKEFQWRSGLLVDGIVGPQTRTELLKYGINPEGNSSTVPQPEPKVKRFPQDFSDRELLEYSAAQLGPKQPEWSAASSLGVDAEGHELTLRDGMAELKRQVTK